MRSVRFLATSVAALTVLVVMSGSTTGAAPLKSLDISLYQETFSDTFRGPLDVTPAGPSKWIAHTPWNGDFGDAAFANPTPGFPFQTGPEGLRITARKAPTGRWESGLLSSVDAQEHGFEQVGGYFEARMKMPPGPGTWPAFWLVSHQDPNYHVEIDVIEYYGVGPEWYQTNLILWPKSKAVTSKSQQIAIKVPKDSLVQAFHTFGVEITDDEIIYYLDRHEIRRSPAPAAARTPMSMLINLALGSGWPIDKTPDPSVLQVDYVKAFKRKP